MADKHINVNIKAKDENATSTIDKVSSKLNSFGKKMNMSKAVSGFSKLNGAISLVSKSFNVAYNACKIAVKGFTEYAAATNKQIKAEKQLELAARNNPYLDNNSVKALKNYASELQKIGTIGDEELLPMMGQLATAGRTQAEIQNIMTAALDLSASGMMSMDSAVSALNATYQGNVGTLGRQIDGLKELTQEELKQGKAVDIIAEKYKGMSKDLTSATGSSAQLANTWGDFKEYIGAPFNAIKSGLEKAANGFLTIINNGLGKVKDSLAKAKETIDKNKEEFEAEQEIQVFITKDTKDQNKKLNKATLTNNQKLLTNANKELAKTTERLTQLESDYALMTTTDKNEKKKYKKVIEELNQTYGYNTEALKEQIELNKQNQEKIKASIALIESKVDAQQKEADSAATRAKLEKENAEREKKATETKEKVEKELNEKLYKLQKEYEAKKALGETDAELTYQEEKLAAYTEAAVKLLTESNGTVTQNNTTFKAYKDIIKSTADTIEELTSSEEAYKQAQNLTLPKKSEFLQQIDEIHELQQEFKNAQTQMTQDLEEGSAERLAIEKTFSEASKALAKQETDLKRAYNEENVTKYIEGMNAVLNTAIDGLNNLNTYFQQAKEAELSLLESETEEKSAALKEQYVNDEISYEEYLAQKDELDKDAARKEYKIKLAEWEMNMAIATAQTAQAVVAALADTSVPMALRVVNSVTAGLLGAAQIASMAGAKPKAPSFSTGGFLTGSSTHGDKIPFKGNAGEAILNPAEQRNFMRLANGENTNGGNINVNMPITIENNASDVANVSAEQDYNRVKITVDKVVTSSMESGLYDNSMQQAQSGFKGKKIL